MCACVRPRACRFILLVHARVFIAIAHTCNSACACAYIYLWPWSNAYCIAYIRDCQLSGQTTCDCRISLAGISRQAEKFWMDGICFLGVRWMRLKSLLMGTVAREITGQKNKDAWHDALIVEEMVNWIIASGCIASIRCRSMKKSPHMVPWYLAFEERLFRGQDSRIQENICPFSIDASLVCHRIYAHAVLQPVRKLLIDPVLASLGDCACAWKKKTLFPCLLWNQNPRRDFKQLAPLNAGAWGPAAQQLPPAGLWPTFGAFIKKYFSIDFPTQIPVYLDFPKGSCSYSLHTQHFW